MTRRSWPRWSGLAVLLTASCALSACGVPPSSPPVVVSAVPFDLLSPSPTGDPRPTTGSAMGPRAYLLDDRDRLVPVMAEAVEGAPAQQVEALLTALQTGPSEADRRRGLSSALGPGTSLRLSSLSDGTAGISIETGTSAPSPGRAPRAVGQIVLSVSTVPGVDDVVLLQSGGPIAVPLPDGVLVDRPVDADDYRDLLADPR